MCFCAGASFTAAFLLSVVGVFSLAQVRARNQVLFAMVPLFFALQQAAEGVVWQSLTGSIDPSWLPLATRTFLSFAYIIWPVIVPGALLALSRRKVLYGFLAVGVVVSAVLTCQLLTYGAEAVIEGSHVVYRMIEPLPELLTAAVPYLVVLYLIPTVGSFFVMRDWLFAGFGLVLLASALISAWVFTTWFTSVWCFFAALLSVAVVFIMHKRA